MPSKAAELVRSKTNIQWWTFHGASIEKAVQQEIAEACAERDKKIADLERRLGIDIETGTHQ